MIVGDVVPVMRGSEVGSAIDVDSDRPAAFGERDQRMLEAVAALPAEKL